MVCNLFRFYLATDSLIDKTDRKSISKINISGKFGNSHVNTSGLAVTIAVKTEDFVNKGLCDFYICRCFNFAPKHNFQKWYEIRFLITVRNSSCGKVMLSQACVKNSVPEVGWGGYLPLGTGGVCLWVWGYTPGQTFHSETVTAADGMHPTGMHSCYASPLSQAQMLLICHFPIHINRVANWIPICVHPRLCNTWFSMYCTTRGRVQEWGKYLHLHMMGWWIIWQVRMLHLFTFNVVKFWGLGTWSPNPLWSQMDYALVMINML